MVWADTLGIRVLAEAINADNGWDLAAYLIIGLPATIPAIGAWMHSRRTGRHTDEIRDQVTNSHKSNLRDDIDQLTETVGRIDDQTRRISVEVQTDRKLRQEADDRLTERITEHESDDRSAISRLERMIRRHHPEEDR